MKLTRNLIISAVLSAGCAAMTAPASAGEVTPMRALVEARELAILEAALGSEAAAKVRDARIVGGKLAKPGKWEFQVGILDAATSDNFDAWFCGGSLVTQDFVVTAAHCVEGASPSQIDVLVGTYDLESGGKRIAAKAITVHPQYGVLNDADSDIAVIELSKAAKNLKRADLINTDQQKKYAKPGKKASVAGWGDTASGSGNYQTKLREVTVPIVSTKNCNDANSYNGFITDTMICAGLDEGGKDSCQGDSGGPLVVKGKSGKYDLLAGVVSTGNGCALPNFFGIYARVAALRDFLDDVIK